jgi:hypothetical protein
MSRFLRASCLLILACAGLGLAASAQEILSFQVKGGNPGGVGGYSAEVTLTKLSKTTAKVRWVAGQDKQVTEGFAIKSEGAIGTAYGPGLYALAVYELKNDRVRATWSLATKPEESGNYELKGSSFEGTLPFADGVPGSVTFIPQKNSMLKVVWDLQIGRYEGIGLRVGDVVVAASGDSTKGFGIGAYTPKGDVIEGLWATTQTDAPGTEVWSLPGDDPKATAGKNAPPAAPAPKKAGDGPSPELAKAIADDVNKCAVIAREFVTHLQAGDTQKAVGLLSDSAFTKVSREDFVKTVEKSNGVFGALKNYKPDKKATDFGVTDGVMTFMLQADAEYANATVRETLKFIRNDKGGIQFVGYNRTVKQ